ncbi:Nitronate monooxygenase [Alloiococcus otitis]|uniref:Probable nitronate monooxygenase n=1 Tax=Alloiococcus otitis ATCC 51267 TaxID=883081 RepID=K9E9Q7_9LACT|nr:nitronate monooxygenase [Alloiococcus otitis]EKU93408.1 hypothetical protein HMPREF9698_01156 [Alloiococcus otitis ATCC 51267]SUU81625.1 Nitronate monooxygenase [Alloiococcus otitis]
MMDERLTSLLGISYPIIQGGMAKISRPSLVSAVSQAGGLGVLTSMGLTPQELSQDIQEVQKQIDQPFAVNLMLQQDNIFDLLEVIKEMNPPVVMTGAGSPKAFVQDLKDLGIKVIPVLSTVSQAKKMEALGVDAIVVEGQEAGGHIGWTSTMAVLPQVVQAVDIPVVAAGGIGSGQAIAAAECLGACGVQLGTLFLSAKECPISDFYRKKLLACQDQDTLVSELHPGGRVRSLKASSQDDPDLLAKEGEAGLHYAGEVAGQVNHLASVQEIMDQLLAQYQSTLAKLIQ